MGQESEVYTSKKLLEEIDIPAGIELKDEAGEGVWVMRRGYGELARSKSDAQNQIEELMDDSAWWEDCQPGFLAPD